LEEEEACPSLEDEAFPLEALVEEACPHVCSHNHNHSGNHTLEEEEEAFPS